MSAVPPGEDGYLLPPAQIARVEFEEPQTLLTVTGNSPKSKAFPSDAIVI